MAKDKTDIPTDGDTDNKPKTKSYSGAVIVVSDGTTINYGKKDSKVSEGISVHSSASTRIEISTMGAHIIFEPLSIGPIPKELFKSARFQEALEANALTERSK